MASDSRNNDKIRELIEEAIKLGHGLRGEIAFWRAFGRDHRKDRNNEVVSVARKLCRNAIRARFRNAHLMTMLRTWLVLRVYAWPVLRRDSNDVRDFWKMRFDGTYTKVEEGAKKLVLLKPESCDEVVKDLADSRPQLEIPDSPRAAAWAKFGRFKRMLRRMKPVDTTEIRRLSKAGMFMGPEMRILAKADKMHSRISKQAWFYAHDVVDDLPKAERKQAMKEIKSLLKRAGYDS